MQHGATPNRVGSEVLARVCAILDPDLNPEAVKEITRRNSSGRLAAARRLREYLRGCRSTGRQGRADRGMQRRRGKGAALSLEREAWRDAQRPLLSSDVERLGAWITTNETTLIGDDVHLAGETFTSWHAAVHWLAARLVRALTHEKRGLALQALRGRLTVFDAGAVDRALQREAAKVVQAAAAAEAARAAQAAAPRKGRPKTNLDDRACALLRAWSNDPEKAGGFTLQSLADALETSRANLIGGARGKRRCPTFYDLWQTIKQAESEEKMRKRRQHEVPRARPKRAV